MKDLEQKIDRQILCAVQSGDQQALGRLYDRHSDWMLAVAYRILQNRRDSEDLLHDVFVEVWNKAGSYNAERGSVRCWLAIRIRSRALDRIRALNKVRNKQADDFEYEATKMSITDESETSVDYLNARRAVEQLSPNQRLVIQLGYFQGLTCQEISDCCEIPLGTVKSRLAAALVCLRQQLSTRE